jgi:hypothetical protein
LSEGKRMPFFDDLLGRTPVPAAEPSRRNVFCVLSDEDMPVLAGMLGKLPYEIAHPIISEFHALAARQRFTGIVAAAEQACRVQDDFLAAEPHSDCFN